MKWFIYGIGIILTSLIFTILQYSGYTLGGIPTAIIFYFGVHFFPSRIIRHIEQKSSTHSENKQATEEISSSVGILSAENSNAFPMLNTPESVSDTQNKDRQSESLQAKNDKLFFISVGLFLILVQLIVIAVNTKTSTNPWNNSDFFSSETFLYDLLYTLPYFLGGIAGTAMIIWGCCKRPHAKREERKEYKGNVNSCQDSLKTVSNKKKTTSSYPIQRGKFNPKILITIGITLIVLQILAIVVNAQQGNNPWNLPHFTGENIFWYDLGYLILYLLCGIVGVVLVIYALPKKRLLVSCCVIAASVLSISILIYANTYANKYNQGKIFKISLTEAKNEALKKTITQYGYYSKPELWTDADRLREKYQALDTEVQSKYEAYQKAAQSTKKLADSAEFLSNGLRNLTSDAKYASDAGAQRMIRDASARYEETMGKLRVSMLDTARAYRDYKSVYEKYTAAKDDYDSYMKQQKAEYDAWKSTIGSEDEIQADLKAATERLDELKYEWTVLDDPIADRSERAQQILKKYKGTGQGADDIRVLIDQQKVAIELLEEELSYARSFSTEAQP